MIRFLALSILCFVALWATSVFAQFAEPDCSSNDDGVVACLTDDTGEFWYAECYDWQVLQDIWDATVWSEAPQALIDVLTADTFFIEEQTSSFGFVQDIGACEPLVAGVQSIEEPTDYTWVWVVLLALLIVLVMTRWANKREKNNN